MKTVVTSRLRDRKGMVWSQDQCDAIERGYSTRPEWRTCEEWAPTSRSSRKSRVTCSAAAASAALAGSAATTRGQQTLIKKKRYHDNLQRLRPALIKIAKRIAVDRCGFFIPETTESKL